MLECLIVIVSYHLKFWHPICWITECRSFVALLISEVVKFISSFKKLSSLFLIFGLKKTLCKIFRTFIVPYVSIWNEKWFDQDLHKKKKQVKDIRFLMSKYPHDPIIRGSFYKINKEYAKLRKKKKEAI
jgi:hypothetical protein